MTKLAEAASWPVRFLVPVLSLVVTLALACEDSSRSVSGPAERRDEIRTSLDASAAADLMVSTRSDRADAVPLSGAILAGDAYVFVAPDDGIDRVEFELDGSSVRTERIAPFDFAGTASDVSFAKPWDTTKVPEGTHVIRALVTDGSGTHEIQASFTIDNDSDPVPTLIELSPSQVELSPGDAQQFTASVLDQHGNVLSVAVEWSASGGSITSTGLYSAGSISGDFSVMATSEGLADTAGVTIVESPSESTAILEVSRNSNRQEAADLTGANLSGDAYVFLNLETGVDAVDFFLDGEHVRTERLTPFDFAGTSVDVEFANPWDTTATFDGDHVIRAVVRFSDATTDTVDSVFAIDNATGSDPVPATVEVSPSTVELDPGEGQHFVATVKDQDGNVLPEAVTWSATGGTITSDGFYSAGDTAGSFVVNATSGSASGEAVVMIVEPTLPTVALKVSTAADRGGATDLSGDVLSGDAYVFAESDDEIARVDFYLDDAFVRTERVIPYDFAGTSADVTFANPWDTTTVPDGAHAIRVDVGFSDGTTASLESGFTVENGADAPVVTTVTVSPASVELPAGDSQIFTAEVEDQNGNPMDSPVSWSATGGTITSEGVYTAGDNEGAFDVTATSEGVTGSAVVHVTVLSEFDVVVDPGTAIQPLIDANPEGTKFLLKAGVHVRQSLEPKDGMLFEGEPGSVMDGEGVVKYAFQPTADHVTIRGLVIENYVNDEQLGAVLGGDHQGGRTGWVVEECEIRFNVGGIRIGPGMVIRDNHIHHNSEIGLGGIGDGVLVEGNEISFNNTAGNLPAFNASGIKIVASSNVTIRNNHVHSNNSKGIWTDVGVFNALIEGNLVEDNEFAGIMHEISYDAIIRNNIVRRNALAQNVGWLWDAGIVVANAPNVEVYGNTVEDTGIGAIHQNRGSGDRGPYELRNLWVHDNTVVLNTGGYGLVQDVGSSEVFTSWNNQFDFNHYTLESESRFFAWANRWHFPDGWQQHGQDLNGTFSP